MLPVGMIEKLREFETRFPEKSNIRLLDAKRYLMELTGIEISDDHVMSYLTAKGYQKIETETPKEEDLDLDDILNMDWSSKVETNSQNIGNSNNGTYVSNTQLLNDYHSNIKKEKAFEHLIIDNMKLVHKVAKRYENYVSHQLTHDDLVSEGVIGLIKAIQKFDVNKDVQFSTYAMWWVRQQILRSIYDTGTTVRVPVHMFEKVIAIKRLELPYLLDGNIPNVKEICKQLNISKTFYEKAKIVEHHFLGITSLDQYVSHEEQDTALGDFISIESHSVIVGGYSMHLYNPSLLVEQKDVRQRIFDVISELTPRQQDVIIERFGLYDNNPKTLEEVGKIYGVTRERIRQIEEKAIDKIRARMTRKMVREDFRWPEQIGG